MVQYPNAASGLKKIFLAQIIAIVGAILCIIPVTNIVGLILALVSTVFYFLGIMEAAKDSEGYGSALTFTIVEFVLGLMSLFLRSVPILGKLIDLAGDVCSIVVLYYICKTTSGLLRNINCNHFAADGDRVWNINKTCLIITAICTVLAIIPLINLIAALILIVIVIVQIYSGIIYIIFLKNSYQSFESPIH